MTTKQKKLILNGKRYKAINETIAKKESSGIAMSESMKIDLHYTHHEMIKKVRTGLDSSIG